MPQEKSQLENMALSPQDGEATKAPQKAPSALPPGFSLGRQLTTKGRPTPRSETLKYSLPSYSVGTDRMSNEERELRIRLEKEEMNYDLYLLIKEKLAGEFSNRLFKVIRMGLFDGYQNRILKKNSLSHYIKNDPQIYTPNKKDLIYIAKNLKELLADQNISAGFYSNVGVFLNSFIHAYFDSVPAKEREDLKINLPNTKDLDFIGAELSFGELEVEEAGDFFGYGASGSVILKAKKIKNNGGVEVCGNTQITAGEALNYFGYRAHGSAILKVGKVVDDVGLSAYESAKIIIEEKHGSIGRDRKNDVQIIMPDGRVLMPGDYV